MSFVSLQLTCRVHLLVTAPGTAPGTAPLCGRNQNNGAEVKVGPSAAWSNYFQIIIIFICIKFAPFTFVLLVYFIGLPAVCFVVHDRHLN
jgi:hypothetical protein